jgi:hypothetical protein
VTTSQAPRRTAPVLPERASDSYNGHPARAQLTQEVTPLVISHEEADVAQLLGAAITDAAVGRVPDGLVARRGPVSR